jgi:dihydrofolate reductase
MRRVTVFEQTSLDGFFADANGEMSWAHKDDPEWNAFAGANAKGGGALLFGRVTYELMASFWPTPQAMEMMPAVAEGMNRMEKFVFSRTLDRAAWNNTTLLRDDPATEVRRMKRQDGPDLVVLGSGSIVSQLAQAGLIDGFQVVVNPIILGRGKSLFEGVTRRLNLKLAGTRAFGNGNTVLTFEPAA